MSGHCPQFYPNALPLARTDKISLQTSLRELRAAVRQGVGLIEAGAPPSTQYDGRGLFSGNLGIAAAYRRLDHQASSLAGSNDPPLPAFHTLAQRRIPTDGPDLPLQVGGLSPLVSGSPLAAVMLRVLDRATLAGSTYISQADLACLREALDLALSHGAVAFYNGRDLGADEILFGRAGLLWGLLNIRARRSVFPDGPKRLLRPILEDIPTLAEAILLAGKQGASDHLEAYGKKDALPLMWTWMGGHCGLGVAHGMTGIISVLLACRPEELTINSHDYLRDIAATITGLCRICIANDGHLPTSIPPRSSSHASPLVQICHGSPAILTLLGCARKCTPLLLNHWDPEWDEAVYLATESVWREGLLSKGGGLCHGITGNAWPFLLLHDSFEYSQDILEKAKSNYRSRSSSTEGSVFGKLTGDYFLSRAITMMLHARETQPYNQTPDTALHDYRMPDHPWSLFEGLAGTVCAWAETCAVIQARLRKMQLEEEESDNVEGDLVFQEHMRQELGFPCVGGNGATGWL